MDTRDSDKKQFTFMLTKDGNGRSIKIAATDQLVAEDELKQVYPDHQIQFLWEWK